MKTKRMLIILAVLLFVYAISCKKIDNQDSLPTNTEVGANTFSFRVQGKEYESHVSWSFPRISVAYNHIDTFFHNNYLFEIEGNRVYAEDNKHVIIGIHFMPKVGVYKLSKYEWLGKGDYATYEDDNPSSLYYGTDSIHTGELTITKLDTINFIISGRFNFKAIESCVYRICNSVITIDGQFDVTYKPNNNINYY